MCLTTKQSFYSYSLYICFPQVITNCTVLSWYLLSGMENRKVYFQQYLAQFEATYLAKITIYYIYLVPLLLNPSSDLLCIQNHLSNFRLCNK